MIDKSDKRDYRLISGEFVAGDARQVLLSLIDDKINFHQRNNWSHRERFGEDNPAVIKRIEELGQTREDITKLVEQADAEGMTLKINSNIEIVLSAE